MRLKAANNSRGRPRACEVGNADADVPGGSAYAAGGPPIYKADRGLPAALKDTKDWNKSQPGRSAAAAAEKSRQIFQRVWRRVDNHVSYPRLPRPASSSKAQNFRFETCSPTPFPTGSSGRQALLDGHK